MSFKKPFRAVPVRLGPYHQAKQLRQQLSWVAKIMGMAILSGIGMGCLMGIYQRGDLSRIPSAASEFAISLGLTRRSTPQSGDYWSGCNDARVAGVTPLYIGEPGYRPEMDGDSDGVACEPYR